MKNIGQVCGDFDGQIYPFLNCSLIKSSTSSCSFGDNAYIFDFFSWNPNLVSITWSHGFHKGKHSNSFFLKTERYLWDLLGTVSSTDFSILISFPMSRLSLLHIHQIDLYSFDQSFFAIVIGSTTFGISASISSWIITDHCGRVDWVLVGSSLGHWYSVCWVSMVCERGGGCTLMAIGCVCHLFLDKFDARG